MARKSNEQNMKEALDGMLKAFKLENKMSEVQLINSWEKIMGPSVANRTTGIRITDGKLFVNLNSASLRQDLFQERENIIKRLNEEAGKEVIVDIIFR